MALPLLLLAATAATAAASASASRSAASALLRQSKLDAKQTELQATQQEADRKQRLVEALASQNAEAGAKGIAGFEGSPLTILQEDIRRESVATERSRFGSDLNQMSIRFRGKQGARALKTQANLSLLKGVTQASGALQ